MNSSRTTTPNSCARLDWQNETPSWRLPRVARSHILAAAKMRNTTSRRTWKRIALFLGILLLLLSCAAIILIVISSRTPPGEEVPVETREIPSGWLVTPPIQTESLPAPGKIESLKPEERVQLPDKNVSGTLAIIGNGKQFGEESYELQVSSDRGVNMTSHGTFSFKVLFATVKAVFSQNISLDRNLRPNRYTLDINGPLGIGSRHVEGTVVGSVVHLTAGDEKEETQIGTDNPLVLGTFSTYAFIPLLFRLLEDGGVAKFQVIPLLGGKGKEDDPRKNDQPIILRVQRAGVAPITVGSHEVLVDKYNLTSNVGNSILLAKGDEFLALIASSDKGSLIAYRSDYFPDGINPR